MTLLTNYFFVKDYTCDTYVSAPVGQLTKMLSYNSSAMNVTLTFSEGEHDLTSEMRGFNSVAFIMYAESANLNACITCYSEGILSFFNISTVQFIGMTFFACGETRIQEISYLTVYNCIFQGYHDSGTALFLINTYTDISYTSFTLNTGTHQFLLDQWMLQRDTYREVGGAIAAYQSDLWINGCIFKENRAKIGGAIYIEKQKSL